MAIAVAERLFQPSAPDKIEEDLAALWRTLGQGPTPIARAVMSNLVVFRESAGESGAAVEPVIGDQPLDEVGELRDRGELLLVTA